MTKNERRLQQHFGYSDAQTQGFVDSLMLDVYRDGRVLEAMRSSGKAIDAATLQETCLGALMDQFEKGRTK